MRVIVFYIAALLLFTLPVLLIAEFTLRYLLHQGDAARRARFEHARSYMVSDPQIGLVHSRNFRFRLEWPESRHGHILYRTNNLGFREDADTTGQKAPGTLRVLVFGDSHTDGVVHNPDSFANLSEALLRQKGIAAEVINAGVGMFSLYQQQLLFERHRNLEPDAAVFVQYAGNDYEEILSGTDKARLRLESDGSVTKIPPGDSYLNLIQGVRFEDMPAPYGPEMLSSSSLVLHRIKQLPAIFRPVTLEQTKARYRDILSQDIAQAAFFAREPERFAEAAALHRYVLKNLRSQARTLPVLLVLLPTRYQIEPDSDRKRFAHLELIFGLNAKQKRSDLVLEDMRMAARASGLQWLDLFAPLREARSASDADLYYYSDHHLNERGHAVVADVLSKRLASILADRIHKN